MFGKKIFTVTLAFFAVLSISINALASQTRFIQKCVIKAESGGIMNIFCSAFAPQDSLNPEQISVILGSNEAEIAGISQAETENVPTTYFCLADISGSLNEAQMNQQKEVLTSISDSMTSGDSMILGTLGESVQLTDTLTEKAKIADAIASLTVGRGDTNLYAAIVDSLKYISSNSGISQRACLVLLSDGQDDIINGYTRDEAIKAVENSTVPIYTVAVLKKKSETGNAEAFGAFSRASAGGKHFVPLIDGITTSKIGQSIAISQKSGIIIKVKTDKCDINSKDEALLCVRFTYVDGSRIEDTKTILTADLPRVENQPAKKSAPVLWIIIAVAALLFIAGLILFIIKKKKPALSELPEESDVITSETELPEAIVYESPAEDKKSIAFTAIGRDKIIVAAELRRNSEVTFGRNEKADSVLNNTDVKLSGAHFILTNTDEHLYIRDCGSRNGTFLNGVAISSAEKYIVENGDIIMAGSYQYRITWGYGNV